jgi:serralysin
MAGGIANVASGVVTIDALLGNLKWGNLNLTYNFPDSVAYYDPTTYFTAGMTPSMPTFNFTSFDPAPVSLQNAITHAITTQLEAVAPLNYTLTTPGDPAADSSFARSDLFNDPELAAPPGGIGYYPGIVDRGGDAWFNVTQGRFNDVDIGDSAYWVVLHELGHTFGLKHGHANDRPGPTTDILPNQYNSMEFSVMTYHRYVGDAFPFNITEEGSFAQSLMMLDIAAIQYMYGANYNTNAGNTVYTFSTTTGEMFIDDVGQGTLQANRIFCTIWDATASTPTTRRTTRPTFRSTCTRRLVGIRHRSARASTSPTISTPAAMSSTRCLQRRPAPPIENAIGGSGDDMTSGNAAEHPDWQRRRRSFVRLDGTDLLRWLGADQSMAAPDVLREASNDHHGRRRRRFLFGGDRRLVADGNDVLNGGWAMTFWTAARAMMCSTAAPALTTSLAGRVSILRAMKPPQLASARF